MCGSPFFIAPEVIQIKYGHSFEVDTWALGIIIYTLLVGKPPFFAKEPKEIHDKIVKGIFTFPMDPPISQEAEALITRLLYGNPNNRPVLEEITIHPFFTKNKIPTRLPRDIYSKEPSKMFLKDYIKVDLKDSFSQALNLPNANVKVIANENDED